MVQPADVAVGALYESLLESALRQFFDRAILDSASTPLATSTSGFVLEATGDPATIALRWFGTRYYLRGRGGRRFTSHEIRLVGALGSVLAARYRAVLNPRVVAERGDLFRGTIEDRYVGAFLDPAMYTIEAREARADRIASIIELLRVTALSSYESHPITTGILVLGTKDDPTRPTKTPSTVVPAFVESLSSIKSFFRLADGLQTLFLANSDGQLLDIINIGRWSSAIPDRRDLDITSAKAYRAHARATLEHGHVCAVLSPSREIKIFAEGAEVFTFRGAAWHLLDLEAKYRVWADAVGNDALALRLFQAALNLSDMREGGLFVVLRRAEADASQLVAPADRLDVPLAGATPASKPTRRDLLHLLEGRSVADLDASVLVALASLDGATVVDREGHLLAAGAILRYAANDEQQASGEGARTTAAKAASQFGLVLKVSEDGAITFLDRDPVWEI